MEFAPFLLLDTDSPLESLQSECQKRAISTDNVQCLLQKHHITLSDPNLPSHALLDDTLYHTNSFTLRQSCDILVRPKLIDSTYTLTLSSDKDKVFMRCLDSFIALDEMEQELYAQVGADLAMLGVILRDIQSLHARLQELLQAIKSKPKMREQEFCIMESSVYVPPKPMRFRFLPQESYQALHQAQARSFFSDESIPPPSKIEEAFYGVDSGELVGVYEFGDGGVAGRNLLGEYCTPSSAKQRIIPSEQEHITHKAYDDRIEYFSQVQGFIALHNQFTAPFAKKSHSTGEQADIFCFYTLPSSPLKSTNTPPLLGGIQAHISLSIESSDSSIDALGDGVYIEAEHIEIAGDLGSSTTIKARHLVINGATHKSSKILAQNAKILTHRGLLITQDCTIKNVDSGTIYAKSARIQEARASSIYAKSIHIDRLRSANSCHFSTQLQVQEIPKSHGDDNALIFSLLGSSDYRDYLYNARAYHRDKSQTLARIDSTLNALLPKLSSAQVFLQKLQGFTKEQQAIALKEAKFSQTYAESLLLIKLYKATLARKNALQKSLHTLAHTTIPALQARLANARLCIGNVLGFENYAHIQKLELGPSELMSESLLLEYNKSAVITIAKVKEPSGQASTPNAQASLESSASLDSSSLDSSASHTPLIHLKVEQ